MVDGSLFDAVGPLNGTFLFVSVGLDASCAVSDRRRAGTYQDSLASGLATVVVAMRSTGDELAHDQCRLPRRSHFGQARVLCSSTGFQRPQGRSYAPIHTGVCRESCALPVRLATQTIHGGSGVSVHVTGRRPVRRATCPAACLPSNIHSSFQKPFDGFAIPACQ